ncbi:hypothetical protein VD0002_g5672 [Verticillium dahliae]|uniref:Uncharacterized protein n=1 Tax=Verticillium dahliae TaxID=27337 RepID=A0A2J8CQQ4_VERDA|nr:hypothetical protein BJF96_g3140 [Verticillium dahliae]PNH39355.1 hypothetical protein VD0004_g7533 [Verticillium dahliae]PNH49984.1 hypothetical protein VD0003_g7174 [Verticillium dahliae]PNH62361.1 hypothetical protein VD0002_g5672 [Verticillium dahliae]PNH69234.1 hypothetical protein VD0001_g7247 [Verticillium dahliae]
MNKLQSEQLKAFVASINQDIAKTFDYATRVEMRAAKGGTSKHSVLDQIKGFRETIA